MSNVGRLSSEMKGYVQSFDNYTGVGVVVGNDGHKYKLEKQDLLSYDMLGAYERVIFQRDLKGSGDKAMNVRRIKW